MKEQTRRAKRMASAIHGEIARMLVQEAQDPRVQNCAITEVAVSNDLRLAKIYFGCPGNSKEVQQGLKRASPFLRRKLGECLEMKFVPELVFELDTRAEQIHHLMQVMGNLNTSSQSV